MGHYTALIHFGREVMGTDNLPVFDMPKMKNFLEENRPWSQLVKLENINIKSLKSDSAFSLNERIKLKPFLVPHRDEFSETVVYEILINNKALIFIADIDKWETNINELIQKVDFAFLDATFYKNGQFIYLLPKLTIPIGLRTSTTSSLKTRYNILRWIMSSVNELI